MIQGESLLLTITYCHFTPVPLWGGVFVSQLSSFHPCTCCCVFSKCLLDRSVDLASRHGFWFSVFDHDHGQPLLFCSQNREPHFFHHDDDVNHLLWSNAFPLSQETLYYKPCSISSAYTTLSNYLASIAIFDTGLCVALFKSDTSSIHWVASRRISVMTCMRRGTVANSGNKNYSNLMLDTAEVVTSNGLSQEEIDEHQRTFMQPSFLYLHIRAAKCWLWQCPLTGLLLFIVEKCLLEVWAGRRLQVRSKFAAMSNDSDH